MGPLLVERSLSQGLSVFLKKTLPIKIHFLTKTIPKNFHHPFNCRKFKMEIGVNFREYIHRVALEGLFFYYWDPGKESKRSGRRWDIGILSYFPRYQRTPLPCSGLKHFLAIFITRRPLNFSVPRKKFLHVSKFST